MSRLDSIDGTQTGSPVVPAVLVLRADQRVARDDRLGAILRRMNAVSPAGIGRALLLQTVRRKKLGAILIDSGALSHDTLDYALNLQRGFAVACFDETPPDPRLLERLGPDECLRRGVLPWKAAGAVTLVAATDPETFARQEAWLTDRLGPVRMVLCPREDQHHAIAAASAHALATLAETRLAPEHSSRSLGGLARVIGTLLILTAGLIVVSGSPAALLLGLVLLGSLGLCSQMVLRVVATIAAKRARPSTPSRFNSRRDSVKSRDVPVITLLVPLYRERRIAARLIKRLNALDYRTDRLDVCLVVEADDCTTRHALSKVDLPGHMRALSVPAGTLRTKPRALNFALDFARGSIIGIYDAEDRPEKDQLQKVVRHFAAASDQVACLQGRLEYYNARTNWLSRCFSIDYALWFRLVLPGLIRLQLPIPLGGTTVFLRRAAIEAAGAWDAHNVTEDADLGIRLARRGYRVEMLDSATAEEAAAGLVQWIRQRSRWIKGYAVTYLVHMRHPAKLWRELGTRRFLGFQTVFLGSLLAVFLAPALWAFWAIPLGLPHPLAGFITPTGLLSFAALFVLAELTALTVFAIALWRPGWRWLVPWVPLMHVYGVLVSVAAMKAAVELASRPFFWDKTAHGNWSAGEPDEAAPQGSKSDTD